MITTTMDYVNTQQHGDMMKRIDWFGREHMNYGRDCMQYAVDRKQGLVLRTGVY